MTTIRPASPASRQAEVAGSQPLILPGGLPDTTPSTNGLGQPGLHQGDEGSSPSGVANSIKIAGEGFSPCKFCGCSFGIYSIRHGGYVCNSCFFGQKPRWLVSKPPGHDMSDCNKENDVSHTREEAQSRKLQGEHSNHHTASGVPDRDVRTHTEDNVAAGTNPSPKTDLANGQEQPVDPRDASYPGAVDGKTGQVSSTEPTEQG